MVQLKWLVLTPLVLSVFAGVLLVVLGFQPRTAYRWALAFPLLALLVCLAFPVRTTPHGDTKDVVCGSVVFPRKGYAGGDYIGLGCQFARLRVVVLATTVGIAGMMLSILAAQGAFKTRHPAEDPEPDVPRARGWSNGDGGGSRPEEQQ